MNRSGAPADCWLLCMIHASYILNHLSCEALGGNVPLGMLYGVSPDISILLLYTFYQPVFYASHNQSYPSASEERAARWVGFGEHVGDALTHKLLDDDTKKILYRSAVRPSDSAHPNKRLVSDRIPSTTPGAEPPRDARDSGSARSHSTHLETSSSDRPKWSPTRSSTRYQDQISVTCTRWTLRMPSFTRATHAQPSLSNFTRRDSNFGERTRSRGTTLGERNFPTSPQNKKTKLTHCSIYVPMRTISTSHAK